MQTINDAIDTHCFGDKSVNRRPSACLMLCRGAFRYVTCLCMGREGAASVPSWIAALRRCRGAVPRIDLLGCAPQEPFWTFPLSFCLSMSFLASRASLSFKQAINVPSRVSIALQASQRPDLSSHHIRIYRHNGCRRVQVRPQGHGETSSCPPPLPLPTPNPQPPTRRLNYSMG